MKQVSTTKIYSQTVTTEEGGDLRIEILQNGQELCSIRLSSADDIYFQPLELGEFIAALKQIQSVMYQEFNTTDKIKIDVI